MTLRNTTIAGVLAIATVTTLPVSADARWRGWGGVGFGLAAGALVVGALAAPRYAYGYYPGYAYSYPSYSYYPSYGYGSYGYYPSYGYGSYGYYPASYGYSYGYPAYSYGYGYGYAPRRYYRPWVGPRVFVGYRRW